MVLRGREERRRAAPELADEDDEGALAEAAKPTRQNEVNMFKTRNQSFQETNTHAQKSHKFDATETAM